MHEKKVKGDIGVAKVIAEATSQLWNVLLPLSEHQQYDLVLEKDGELKRVQVRYTSINKFGTISVKLRTSWADKNGTHNRSREKNDYDILAVYCPGTEKVYFIDAANFNNTAAINLRVSEAKSGQRIGIRMADDYLIL